MEKTAKPSRALSIIDVIIKLLAVGALWAIFAMLLGIRGNLDKMVNNSEGIRIRMLGNVGTSIPFSIRLQDVQGGTFSLPWYIKVKE